MEDVLKILKVEYLSNHLLDHTQILNLSLCDQAIFCKSFKWRQPTMEDDLNIGADTRSKDSIGVSRNL